MKIVLALAASTSASQLRKQPLQPDEHRLLCRVRPGDGAGGRALDVWQLPGNARAVSFEDSMTMETTAHCTGLVPSCGAAKLEAVDPPTVTQLGSCPACPCELDTTAHILESQRAMVDAIVPRCQMARADKPVDVLLLGLGGGIVHSLVRSSCPTATRVRSVEIDARFAEAASRYFGLPLEAGESEVVVGDAGVVVGTEVAALGQSQGNSLGANGWDLVAVDCFIGGGQTPLACRSPEFVSNLKKVVKPGGEVVHHMWNRSPKIPEVAQEFNATVGEYRNVFGEQHVSLHGIYRANPSLRLDDLVISEVPAQAADAESSSE